MDIFAVSGLFRRSMRPDEHFFILMSREASGKDQIEFAQWALTDDPESVRIQAIIPEYGIIDNKTVIDRYWLLISYKKRV